MPAYFFTTRISLITHKQLPTALWSWIILKLPTTYPRLNPGTEALTTPWGTSLHYILRIFFLYSMHMLILEIRPTSIYHPIGTYYESTTCTSL
jgi:hypothetical protein